MKIPIIDTSPIAMANQNAFKSRQDRADLTFAIFQLALPLLTSILPTGIRTDIIKHKSQYATPTNYWGPNRLISAAGAATQMRDRLVVSILRAFGTVQLDGIGPEGFRHLLQFFSIKDMEMTGLDLMRLELRQQGALDRVTEKYLCTMHIQHWHVQIAGRNVPTFGTAGLSMWMTMQLLSDPGKAGRSLDALLQNSVVPLHDPDTGLPFVYKSIPTELLPEYNASVEHVKNEAEQEWATSRKELVTHLVEQFGIHGSHSTKEGCGGHTDCIGIKQPVIANNSQAALSSSTAQNIQRMQIANLEASLAAQNAWNVRQNIAKMSWANSI